MISDLWLPGLSLVSVGAGTDGGARVGASVSLGAPFSSASSVISISLRRRRELEEDVIDPEAVCKRHADERALSLRSEASVRVRVVSFENLSRIDWN